MTKCSRITFQGFSFLHFAITKLRIPSISKPHIALTIIAFVSEFGNKNMGTKNVNAKKNFDINGQFVSEENSSLSK